MRWVQKVVEGGEPAKYHSFLVLDEDGRKVNPAAGVTPDDAARMVATGAWEYVDNTTRPA